MDALEPRRGGRQRDAARQAAILRATTEVLAEDGFEGLTLDAVARRARASRSTIYRWWDSPTELVVAALDAHVKHEVPEVDTGSLRGDLVALLTWYADVESDERAGLVAGLVHAMHTCPEVREVVLRQLVELEQARVTTAILARATERGELPPGADVRLLREVFVAMLALRTLLLVQSPDADWIDHVVDRVLLPVLRAT